ncbi:MAG: dUTP diphosphatase [Elusimicrobiales bacterium]
MKIKVRRICDSAHLPDRAYENDAGADLFSIEEVHIQPHSPAMIKTGIEIALPRKTCGIIWGKSSIENKGLIVTAGLIDEGYRGEIIVCMFNLTDKIQVIEKGQKIAQLVVIPVYYPKFKEVKKLPKTKRGIFGFGSTGHKKDFSKPALPSNELG